MDIFGFSFNLPKKRKKEKRQYIAVNTARDGSSLVETTNEVLTPMFSGADVFSRHQGGLSQSSLVDKYRTMSMYCDVDVAIQEIINEMVGVDDDVVSIDIDKDSKVDESIRKNIIEEFDHIKNLLDFNTCAFDILRDWYIDGRIYYQKVIDSKNSKSGILELVRLEPKAISKIREIIKDSDDESVIVDERSYYLYTPGLNDTAMTNGYRYTFAPFYKSSSDGTNIIAGDSIAESVSGLIDPNGNVLSYLHKALKPYNQLFMMEDSLIIYRIARAPERRMFYVDVGNLPKTQAEQYLTNIMNKYRNKISYNAETGEITDDRKFASMTEDYWLPRREGSRGTEIDTLSEGNNLGEIEDIEYFQKKLYTALGVPRNRLEADQSFRYGSGENEIEREELRFHRFINRLRVKFSEIFYDLLKTQLLLKRIISTEEWEEYKDEIRFRFMSDSSYEEMKNMQIWSARAEAAKDLEDHIGKYISNDFVRRNIFNQSDEDIESEDSLIKAEKNDEQFGDGY